MASINKELEVIKLFKGNCILFDTLSNEYIVHNDYVCGSCKGLKSAISAFYSNLKHSL